MENFDNENFKDEGTFKKELKERHLFMLALGGVIGTGLFLTSGYTISQAGPFGTVVGYILGAVVVYLVMLCLGQMSAQMPLTGSFGAYASRFISPATGFCVTLLYWICWAVALGSEFVGAAILMARWFPEVPTWIFAVGFASLIFFINALSPKVFGESEFWFSSIKVIAIIVFIILGFGAIFGFVEFDGAKEFIGFKNLTKDGFFPNGTFALITTMLAINYAFSGTELIGIASGETKNPEVIIPKVIKTTIFRLVVFFVLTIVVLSSLLPMQEAGVLKAPFVVVFDKLNLPYAADIMNFVILTAILSAGNSGLYACTRMLWSLANEGQISKKFVKINSYGVPFRALIFSMIGALGCLFSSIYSPDLVFLALVSIAGFAVVGVWISIPISQIAFKKEWIKSGKSENQLVFKIPFGNLVPYMAIFLLLVSLVGIAFDESQRAGLYFGIPFVGFCYLYHYIRFKNGKNL